jgi:hypothetical protein
MAMHGRVKPLSYMPSNFSAGPTLLSTYNQKITDTNIDTVQAHRDTLSYLVQEYPRAVDSDSTLQ